MQSFEYDGKKYQLNISKDDINILNRIEVSTQKHEQKIDSILEKNEKGEKIVKIVHPYEKYISMFMEEFRKNKDEKTSDEIEKLLKSTSDLLEAVDPDYQEELNRYYGGNEFYIKKRTEYNLEVHDFINKPGNEVFKNNVKEFVTNDHLNIELDFDKLIKNNPGDFNKIKEFKPAFGENYQYTLIKLFRKFGEYEMFGDFNKGHDEGDKKYAAVHLINARRKMIEFFAPGSDEIDTFDKMTPEKKKAFFEEKVSKFKEDELLKAQKLYAIEKVKYQELLEIAKNGLSNEDCSGNLDVFRNKYEDAIITKEPIVSTALSSALYMYKMIRNFGVHTEGKDPTQEAMANLEMYFNDPSSLFSKHIKKDMKVFSTDNLKNLNRGKTIFKFANMANDYGGETGYTSVIERFKECETRINPEQTPEFVLASQFNQDLLFSQMASLSQKYQRLFEGDNLSNLIERVAILNDEDFSNPKNIAFSEYVENDVIVPNIDLDQYFTLNCVSADRMINNLNVIVDQIYDAYNNDRDADIYRFDTGTLALAIQNIASNMMINHYYELSKENKKAFMNMIEKPIDLASQACLRSGYKNDLAAIKPRKKQFKAKIKEVEKKEKAFNKFEKSFVKEENKFNKNYKEVLSKLEDAKNKNIEADITKYENQLKSMRDAEVAKLNNYYQDNKLPTSYVFNRIDSLYKDEVQEVKGIFKTSGYNDSYEYCQALFGEEAHDLTFEEQTIIYRRDLQDKLEFIKEGTKEKIDLNIEVERVTTRQKTKEASQLALQQALSKSLEELDTRPKSKAVVSNKNDIELNNEISTSVKKK